MAAPLTRIYVHVTNATQSKADGRQRRVWNIDKGDGHPIKCRSWICKGELRPVHNPKARSGPTVWLETDAEIQIVD